MPAVAAKILDECHPDYDAGALRRRRALYEGGQATRRLMRELLPKMPKEPGDRYKDRIKRAVYLNYSGPICNFYASYLFSKPPRVEVEGAPGRWYHGDEEADDPGFLENVDRKRSTWSGFWRDRLIDAFVGQCAYAWVNLPASPEERANRLEQERAGDLDAYLVRIRPEEVINWEENETGELTWVLVRQELEIRPSVIEPRKCVIRWTYVSATEVVVWEWAAKKGQKEPKPEEEIPERSRVLHGLASLPIVRLKLPKGFWLMEQLHDPAMATFYAENDLGWAAYNTAHSVMWIRSKWMQEGPPTIADGYFLQLFRDKDGEDEAGWLEIDGASHEVLRKRSLDLRQELYRVANQLALSGDQGAGEAARSGESKAMDYQSVSIVAKEFAGLLRSAMRQTIRLVSEARDDKATPKVSGLEGYKAVDVIAFLDAAAQAKPLVKSERFRKEVAKAAVRHTLGEDLEKETVAEIEQEIEDADYSIEEIAPYNPPSIPAPNTANDDDDDDADE